MFDKQTEVLRRDNTQRAYLNWLAQRDAMRAVIGATRYSGGFGMRRRLF